MKIGTNQPVDYASKKIRGRAVHIKNYKKFKEARAVDVQSQGELVTTLSRSGISGVAAFI